MYLSNKAKSIIGIIIGVLVIGGVVGGSIAIAKASKKNQQSKCEHVYDAGVVSVEAECESPGMIVYTCSECDFEYTEEIPANGHVQTVIEAIPATCTSKGLTDGLKCVTCEKVLVVPVETPILGHKLEALKAVAATCTTAGKTEGAHCTRCGMVTKAQAEIPAKGHTVVELKGYEATCTQAGKTNGSICSTCGKVYSAQEDIPATGHNVVGDTCTICGITYATPYVDYAEEAIGSTTVAAGNVFRIYKDVDYSQVDGNFLKVTASFAYELTDGLYENNTATVIYIGVLNNGDLVASFEPMENGYGLVKLTAENTSITYHEADSYYDIVFKSGDTIVFTGANAYGGEVTGTFTLGSVNTVGSFGDKVYLLEDPASASVDVTE